MKRLKQILSKVLEIDEDQITEETSPDNVEAWDSFNHLIVISEIESEFDMKFTMDEVNNIKSYKDLEIIMRQK